MARRGEGREKGRLKRGKGNHRTSEGKGKQGQEAERRTVRINRRKERRLDERGKKRRVR